MVFFSSSAESWNDRNMSLDNSPYLIGWPFLHCLVVNYQSWRSGREDSGTVSTGKKAKKTKTNALVSEQDLQSLSNKELRLGWFPSLANPSN